MRTPLFSMWMSRLLFSRIVAGFILASPAMLFAEAQNLPPLVPTHPLPDNEQKTSGTTPTQPAAQATTQATSSSKTTTPVQLGASAAGHVKDCHAYAREHDTEHVLVLDAATKPPRFYSLRDYTYTGSKIRVCIQHVDHTKRYDVFANYTELPPASSPIDLSDLFKVLRTQQSSRCNAPTFKDTDNDKKDFEAARGGAGTCQETVGGMLGTVESALRGLATNGEPPLHKDEAQNTKNLLTEKLGKLKTDCGEISKHLETLQTLASQYNQQANNFQCYIKNAEEAEQRAKGWTTVFDFALRHLEATDSNLFNVASRANTEAEIVVRSTPLVLSKKDGEAKESLSLSYGTPTDIARYSLQIRSLAYVRFGLAVGYSSTHGQSVTTARNDLGVDVLRRNDDLGITPMVVMTHYWCGADERRIQPWDKSRSCWGRNLVPTIAIGVPITSSNALQHFFLGLVWQPIPAIGFIAGGHIGRVNRVRAEFFDGMAVQSGNVGFRPDVDAMETVTRLGWYVGAVITDATFVKLLRDMLGGNK
ncbi:MAG TPA: hypothetical protein PKE31_00045 [Pseudomonadota bacterium]|nr:hypothetical protein [Pseudomonadota bacterium]